MSMVPSSHQIRKFENRKTTEDKTTPVDIQHAGTSQSQMVPPLVEQYLLEGKLVDGERAMVAYLQTHQSDDQARFGLGVLQFIRAIERLGQQFYRFGLRSTRSLAVPFLRIPIDQNPHPESITYEDARRIMDELRGNLLKSEATLAQIRDADVRLPLHFGLIKIDLNGDHRCDENETLWKLYSEVNHIHNVDPAKARDFYIKFDRGDVHWLRGYCHLLAGLCDVYLAHDSKESFDCTAHIFFSNAKSPYPFLAGKKRVYRFHSDDYDVVDLIAMVHLIRWNVIEPKRMEAALHHFEQVVAQSKESWKWIMAETDDDHEWIPNPNQTGVIPNVRVTPEMVSAWGQIMDQLGQILAGKKLVPFWRGDNTRGVNVRKVFLQPRTLDLIEWVQGPAAAPFLEEGELTQDFREQIRVFGNNFPGFAFWFN